MCTLVSGDFGAVARNALLRTRVKKRALHMQTKINFSVTFYKLRKKIKSEILDPVLK